MDFIERVFHVDPDGGSGSLEALYVAVAVLLVGVVLSRRPLIAAMRRLTRFARRSG